MKVYRNPKYEDWQAICRRPLMDNDTLFIKVKAIIDEVGRRGDAALIDFVKQFEGADLESLSCSQEEFTAADEQVSDILKADIRLAIQNVKKFHTSQKIDPDAKVETTPGVVCWRESRAIENVGLYIPGGTAPLFSSVIMLAVPAVIAGCKNIVMCTPAGKTGQIHPAILWTAREIGISQVFKIGGAQAIAAMAKGSESVPKVDKIFGPGNQYVTAAKQLLSLREVAIDMPAGPSEVLVLADSAANPVFAAADLLSQAEHGTDSQAILVTDCKETLENVLEEVEKQLELLPRKDIARISLSRSAAVLLKSKINMLEFSNMYAPEHLICHVKNMDDLLADISNAGSVFVGPYTPESAGDYASGTNHTLPTNGYSRAYSGVSLDSYVKKITFQKITKEGLSILGPAVERMAQEEKLDGHKNAVTVRLKTIQEQK